MLVSDSQRVGHKICELQQQLESTNAALQDQVPWNDIQIMETGLNVFRSCTGLFNPKEEDLCCSSEGPRVADPKPAGYHSTELDPATVHDRNTLSPVSIIEQPVVDNDPSNQWAPNCVIDVPVLTAERKR
jgi:hypothetical protein